MRPASLELSQRSRLQRGAGHNVRVIRPGQDKPRTETDVALHGVEFVDAAHAEKFACLAASRADAAVGGFDAWVKDLSGNSHLGGQVGGSDQQAVDPFNLGNAIDIGEPFEALDHCDHKDLRVDRGLGLGVGWRFVAEQGGWSAPAPRPQRRITKGRGDLPGLIDRIDMRYDDACGAVVERSRA